MKRTTFLKSLSANDVGATGAHQAGILVPKTNKELLGFLPKLSADIKNPSTWIDCLDEAGASHRFRYVYYNNALHDSSGTRNEYRLTHMTGYFRECGARAGDLLEISRLVGESKFSIKLIREEVRGNFSDQKDEDGFRIRIRTGWSRVH